MDVIMRFAHMGDCHLGGWRFPEIQEVVITSGARDNKYTTDTNGGRYVASWHDESHGYSAIDFVFSGINHFLLVSTIVEWLTLEGFTEVGGDVSEFEVCKAKKVQHFHIATGKENPADQFTGIY